MTETTKTYMNHTIEVRPDFGDDDPNGPEQYPCECGAMYAERVSVEVCRANDHSDEEYAAYCKAKREIDEEPLTINQWREFPDD